MRRLRMCVVTLFMVGLSTGLAVESPHELVKAAHDVPSGEPDLICQLEEVWSLPPGVEDSIRTFILPLPVEEGRYVKSVQISSGGADEVMRMAILRVDPTHSGEEVDAEDEDTGFDHIPSWPGLNRPEQLFVAQEAASSVVHAPKGSAWRLHPISSLVLTLYLRPGAEPRELQPSVRFWFADEKPEKRLLTLRMSNESLSIPPGADQHQIEDSFTLPVSAELVGMFPWAHDQTRRIDLGTRSAPEAELDPVASIDGWDRQQAAPIQFAEPVPVEAGTQLWLEFTFRNTMSEAQPSPQVARWGNQLSNARAEVFLQFTVDEAPVAARFARAIAAHQMALAIESAEARTERDDSDLQAHLELAELYADFGQLPTAVAHSQKSVDLAPENSRAHSSLAATQLMQEYYFSAQKSLERAIELDPENATAWYLLGIVQINYGIPAPALESFLKAQEIHPRDQRIANNLGTIYMAQEEWEKAEEQFQKIIRVYPEHVLALANLGQVYEEMVELELAREYYVKAAILSPEMREILEERIRQLGGSVPEDTAPTEQNTGSAQQDQS